MKFNPESFKKFFKIPEKKKEVFPTLPKDHWFKIAERLWKKSGEIPDPLQIRASAIVDALGIPSGPYSALSQERHKIDPKANPEEWEKIKKKDKIIAEYLTNKPGVLIDKETGIVSSDFRDIYPEGLPEKLKKVLDPNTAAIMEAEYKHAEDVRKRFGETEDELEADCTVHYFRLHGGIDLFSRGYVHDKQ